MSDLWFEATANTEQENTDRLLIAARQEVAPLIGFLTAAYSQQDYENRKALVRDKMFSAVASVTVEGSPEFNEVASLLEQSFDEDYATVEASRPKTAYSPDEQEAITGGGTIIDEAEARNLLATYGGYGEVRVYGLYGQNSVYAGQIAAIKSDIMLDEKAGELDFLWAKSTSDTLKQMIRPAHKTADEGATSERIKKSIHTMIMEARPDAQFVSDGGRNMYRIEGVDYSPGEADEKFMGGEWSRTRGWMAKRAAGTCTCGHERGVHTCTLCSCGDQGNCTCEHDPGSHRCTLCHCGGVNSRSGRRKTAMESYLEKHWYSQGYDRGADDRAEFAESEGINPDDYSLTSDDYMGNPLSGEMAGQSIPEIFGSWDNATQEAQDAYEEGYEDGFQGNTRQASRRTAVSSFQVGDYVSLAEGGDGHVGVVGDVEDTAYRVMWFKGAYGEDDPIPETGEGYPDSAWYGDSDLVKASKPPYATATASRRTAVATPDWLSERNNDPYGTPSNHEFWGTVDFEDIGDHRIFQKDGGWFVHNRRYNTWMKYGPDEAGARAYAGGPNIDFNASRRTAGVYCKTHDVWVGDGNADTHEGCEKEQRATEKTKDASRRRSARRHPFGRSQKTAAGRFEWLWPGTRKPDQMVVYPTEGIGSDERIAQGGRSIVQFNINTGEGVANWKGSDSKYFVHLSPMLGAESVTMPAEFIEAALGVEYKSGDPIGGGGYFASKTALAPYPTATYQDRPLYANPSNAGTPKRQFILVSDRGDFWLEMMSSDNRSTLERQMAPGDRIVDSTTLEWGSTSYSDWELKHGSRTAAAALTWTHDDDPTLYGGTYYTALGRQSDLYQVYVHSTEGPFAGQWMLDIVDANRWTSQAEFYPTLEAAQAAAQVEEDSLHTPGQPLGARKTALRFVCPEHGDTAEYEDGEAWCVDREESLDLEHPDVIAAIEDAGGKVDWVHESRKTAAAKTPTQIAAELQGQFPHLNIHFGNTGGGVMCIVAWKDLAPEQEIIVGTAAGNLGWSDGMGEVSGEWEDLVNTVDDDNAWALDKPLAQGDEIQSRIAGVLSEWLPHVASKIAGWEFDSPGFWVGDFSQFDAEVFENGEPGQPDYYGWAIYDKGSDKVRSEGVSPSMVQARHMVEELNRLTEQGIKEFASRKTAQWVEDGDASEYESEGIGEAYVRPHYEIATTGEGDREEEQDGWDWDAFTYDSLPTRGTGHSPDREKAKELAAKWVQDNAGGVGVGQLFSRKTAAPKGYDTLTPEQVELYDLIMEIVDWPWFGTVTPANLLDVASITRRQLASRALNNVISRNDAERRGDTGYVKVLDEGIARDDAWGKALDGFIERGWTTSSKTAEVEWYELTDYAQGVDENGKSWQLVPGPYELISKDPLVLSASGRPMTVYTKDNIQEWFKDVRGVEGSKTAADRPEPWPESACGEQDEDTFCVLDVGHGDDHAFRSRQWIENVLPAPTSAPVEEEVPEEGDEEAEQPEQAEEEEPAKDDSNVPPQFKKK